MEDTIFLLNIKTCHSFLLVINRLPGLVFLKPRGLKLPITNVVSSLEILKLFFFVYYCLLLCLLIYNISTNLLLKLCPLNLKHL